MKIDKINTALGLTANFGVLIGLMFVIFELKQNQESLDASIHLSLSAAYQEYLALLFATYELRNGGVVSEQTWIHNARYFALFLETPQFRKLYEDYSRIAFPEEFFLAIEEQIRN